MRREAKQNGVPEDLLRQIVPDDTATQAGDSAKTEVETDEDGGRVQYGGAGAFQKDAQGRAALRGFRKSTRYGDTA